MSRPVFLITGCSTGFGRELAQVAASKGAIVVGTLRKESQIPALEALSPGNIHAVLMDVTSTEQIEAGVREAISRFGRIDVLVNNAGYGSLGPVEAVTDQEMQAQFEVNVFGPIKLIRAVLPQMRKQRSGAILNITSIAGLNGFPGVGVYNGSKFALEGIGEALHHEVKHLGIRVTNIEPGPFRTDWAGRSANYYGHELKDYEETAVKNIEAIARVSGTQIGDPRKGAEAMYQVAMMENPPIHLPLGGPAYKRARIKLNRFLEEIDEYEHIGLPTDFEE